jgi:hypothetical protein
VDKAREKALKEATRYAGYPVDETTLQEIVNLGLNPILA